MQTKIFVVFREYHYSHYKYMCNDESIQLQIMTFSKKK